MKTPFKIAIRVVSDHLRTQFHLSVESGPGAMMTPDELATHRRKVNGCADRMDAAETYREFEVALDEAHQLGMYPYNADVGIVAQAGVLFAD